jgi:hypothetical protein
MDWSSSLNLGTSRTDDCPQILNRPFNLQSALPSNPHSASNPQSALRNPHCNPQSPVINHQLVRLTPKIIILYTQPVMHAQTIIGISRTRIRIMRIPAAGGVCVLAE